MGTDGGGGRLKDKHKHKEEEQDGMSVHSPCKAPPSSASSLPKEQSQVELELRLLEALEIYPPVKLRGRYTSSLCPLWSNGISAPKVFDRNFSSDEVLQLLDRFYNLEMLDVQSHFTNIGWSAGDKGVEFDLDSCVMRMLDKPDDEEMEILNHEEDFSLPQSYFVKEES
ncbi:hypothetical protein JRO89_XS05G0030200 [Xanthoceras sorbifolium]|uniref:Uncharacterized protein n=1 Tax=Xanthoceras sorbifolium TaxID=99658 RepID=A0ABQ8I059_9ROSI|nr:hypothetical protein JRO89_XS05G0030200 [Xanthoceras sorbifolium]